MSSQTPAGWYNDGHGQLRYWDGQRWTENTAPIPVATPQPAPPVPSVPVQPAAVPAPIAPQQTGVAQTYVPLFGARKAAKEYAAKLGELGALDLVEIERQTDQARRTLDGIRGQIMAATADLQTVQAQLVDVRNAYNLQEFGLFDFAHPAESSATLANRLEVVRNAIKQAVRDGQAVTATRTFTFNNSAAQGKKFIDSMSKGMLAAYNAEAENCVKAVRAGNLETARGRLSKSADRIAQAGTMISLRITDYYQRLRLDELTLAAQHLHAQQVEKEKEREERERLREQRRVEEQLRKERERLDKERQHYMNLIATLRERGDVAGAAEFAAKLADVEKAISDVDYRAANARAGYVYVISNIGAFGDRMVKIGMTRRLDPMERVNELGDASVPFRFDVHALFFADDAVAIETMLHQEFAEKRVNKVNIRREFFYCTPAEVLTALQRHKVAVVEYTNDAEAPEFRLSGGSAAVPPAPSPAPTLVDAPPEQ